MALIDISNLTFGYEGSLEPVFNELYLQLDTDWKLGFIGRNGYGKTTFLKLLMDEYSYSGSILKPFPMAYFPFPISNYDLITVDLLGILETDFELWKVQREMKFLEVEEEALFRVFSTLSGGEQTKILLALLFSKDERFLLIDEPTNHLDSHGRDVVAKYLASKKGFILVSHDREFINQSVDHILTIEKNKVVLQKGNYDTWEMNKNLEDKFELDKNEKLKKEIRRLSQSSREKSSWSNQVEASKFGQGPVDRGFIGRKAAKMMKRSKAIEKRYEKALEDKEQLLKNVETIEGLQINILNHHANNYVVMDDFAIDYGKGKLFAPIQLTISPGECLVLRGDNGCGKSSIIRAILKEENYYSGRLEVANGLIISYVPQKFDHVHGSINDFVEDEKLDKTTFLTTLRKLGFSRIQFDIPIENFSMGQKKKIFLAKSMCEEAHLFIWDEPFNYIDIISRIQIENMILEYSPTMILVEHDKRFVGKVATGSLHLLL